jgi:hypothetical protein
MSTQKAKLAPLLKLNLNLLKLTLPKLRLKKQN